MIVGMDKVRAKGGYIVSSLVATMNPCSSDNRIIGTKHFSQCSKSKLERDSKTFPNLTEMMKSNQK
jgi:hypothetical protein